MWVGPKTNDKCSYKRQSSSNQTQRARPGEDEGRDWRDAPAGHWSPRELEEQGTILSYSLQRAHSPGDTWISNFCL